MSYQFDPDWVIAPGETLREWLDTNGLSNRVAAAAVGRTAIAWAEAVIDEVLRREPLTENYARVLERVTGIPARMWLALEHNYRVGLAAGKHDETDG